MTASIWGGIAVGPDGVVNSVAELRAVVTTATFIETTGYYTKGDGGAGFYYYDSADTVSADNGGTIIVAADNKRWKLLFTDEVNVHQFGAYGDNIHDDSAAFNSALNYCPIVRCLNKGYLLSRPINLTSRRIADTAQYWGRQLIGMGPEVTKLNCYTGIYPCIDMTGGNGAIIAGFEIRTDNPPAGFTAANCASTGILIRRGSTSGNNGAANISIRDVRTSMSTDKTRNGGLGTIGLANISGEHHIYERFQAIADLPALIANTSPVAISSGSDLPSGGGALYEIPGASVSTSVIEMKSCQLQAIDSHRQLYLSEVFNLHADVLYMHTIKRLLAVPVNSESIKMFSCSLITIAEGSQEVSGLFGATYRMDHRYLTYDGVCDGISFKIRRAVFDLGFTIPGAAEVSVMALNAGSLINSTLDCNYFDSIYTASGDNNGFAALPVGITGVPTTFRNCRFILDKSGTHNSAFFTTIGQYCTNVWGENYRGGDTRRCDGIAGLANVLTPVAIGLTTAGAGTYTFRSALFERVGGWCMVNIVMAWSAHTGTGGLAITGLPYTSDANQEFALSVSYDGYTVGAGKQLTATIPANQSRIILNQADPAGGALLGAQVDGTVTLMTITGMYKVHD